MNRLFPLFLCTLLFLGCEIVSGGDDPTPQQFLFEVEHNNAAWVPTWIGFYVDSQGNVNRYDLSNEEWTPKSPDSFTEAELLEKYNHHKARIGTINQATLQEKVALIRPASEGALSERKHLCADAGITKYRAYRYDPRGSRYTPVLLQAEGDIVQKNLSTSAQALLTWLKTLDERFSHSSCVP